MKLTSTAHKKALIYSSRHHPATVSFHLPRLQLPSLARGKGSPTVFHRETFSPWISAQGRKIWKSARGNPRSTNIWQIFQPPCHLNALEFVLIKKSTFKIKKKKKLTLYNTHSVQISHIQSVKSAVPQLFFFFFSQQCEVNQERPMARWA